MTVRHGHWLAAALTCGVLTTTATHANDITLQPIRARSSNYEVLLSSKPNTWLLSPKCYGFTFTPGPVPVISPLSNDPRHPTANLGYSMNTCWGVVTEGVVGYEFSLNPASLMDVGTWSFSCDSISDLYELVEVPGYPAPVPDCQYNGCLPVCDDRYSSPYPSETAHVHISVIAPPFTLSPITLTPPTPAWNARLTFGAPAQTANTPVSYHWALTARPPGSTRPLLDANTATPQILVNSDTDIGNWEISLDADDSLGQRRSTKRTFTVVTPQPSIQLTGTTQLVAGAPMVVDVSPANDPFGAPFEVKWDLVSSSAQSEQRPRDGFAEGGHLSIPTGARDIGTWVLRATATNTKGPAPRLSDSKQLSISVTNPPLTIALSGIPQRVLAGAPVHLEDHTVVDRLGQPLSFSWDLVQVPVSAGIPIQKAYSTVAAFDLPTTLASAGTWVRVLRTSNPGPLQVSLDPSAFAERTGTSAALYVVQHKTPAEWLADPSLHDVAGGPITCTFTGPSIANQICTTKAVPIGTFDVVFDFGNAPDDPATFQPDGRLDPGDLIDTVEGAPSVEVLGDPTAGALALASPIIYGEDGSKTVRIAAGFDKLRADFNFRIRGQIIRPATVNGRAPLVVFVHGNHKPLHTPAAGGGSTTASPAITSGENFAGYTWLQNKLAAQGFITMSVDLDDASGRFPFATIGSQGILIRAWITLKNIEALLAGSLDPATAPLVDSSRVYLIGHSRGGEAVLVARDQLLSTANRPAGGKIDGLAGVTVRGIVSLAPVSFVYDTTQPAAVPYLLLVSSADGDVDGASAGVTSFVHYDRASGDKAAIRVMGANHNAYNMSWAYSDSMVPTTVGADLISPDAQRAVGGAYIGAFLSWIDAGRGAVRAYFTEQPRNLRPVGVDPGVVLHSEIRLASRVPTVVDDYEANPAVALSSSGGLVENNVLNLIEGELFDRSFGSGGLAMHRMFEATNGAVITWNAPSEYSVTLTAGAAAAARPSSTLSFRAALQPEVDPITTVDPGPRNLRVALEDVRGKTSEISLDAFDSIAGIYPSSAGGGDTTSAAFSTFRIPLSAFVVDGRDLDLSQIVKVHLKLGAPSTSTGRIALDDVEIEP
ncbi:MAG: hypothetical protein JST92_18165 [Deltaproteobacteria bacterium]|nr:hypothetical protein [Deltaproteobacteria bacterium]